MAGEEKRHTARVRRRVKVVFDHDPRVGAFTTNLSRGGICVASDYVASSGSEVSAAVQLPSGQQANFEAVVVWSRKVRGNLTQKSTMGLEFVIPPGEDYNRFIDDALAMGSETATRESQAIGSLTGPALSAVGPTVGRRAIVTGPAIPAVGMGDGRVATSPAEPARPQTPPRERATTGLPSATLAFPAPPIGLSGRTSIVIEDDDLAAGSGYLCGVSTAVAALWCEEAAVRCLRDILPGATTTVGLSTHVRARHDHPVRTGDKVVVTARVLGALDERTVTLDVRIESNGVLIAGGQHVRALIGRS